MRRVVSSGVATQEQESVTQEVQATGPGTEGGDIVVEQVMPFVSVPSVKICVTDAGPSLLYLCDQRGRNRGFTGRG